MSNTSSLTVSSPSAPSTTPAPTRVPSRITFKVSGKGAVSVYGLQRFPVTLYGGQWDRLLAAAPELASFIEANRSLLTTKS